MVLIITAVVGSFLLVHSHEGNVEYCQKQHLAQMKLINFNAALRTSGKKPCDESTGCDLHFRARFLKNQRDLKFFNGFDNNDFNETNLVNNILNYTYPADQQNIILQVEFAEIDSKETDSGKIFGHIDLNDFNPTTFLWQQNHTINTTINEVHVHLIRDNIGLTFKRNAEWVNTTINYTVEVSVKREDCLTTTVKESTTLTSTKPSKTTVINTSPIANTSTANPSPLCQSKGGACTKGSCCNATCGGFSDERGQFKSCGLETPNVGPARLLVTTDQNPYILPYPVSNAHLNDMLNECQMLDGYLSCDDQRVKRQDGRSGEFRSLKSSVQNIQVELRIPIPKLPGSCSALATSCTLDQDCCFSGTGFGQCVANMCALLSCKKPSDLCSTNDECCSQECKFEWSINGSMGKRCGTKPENDKCNQNDQCQSYQCCKDGNSKKCYTSICPDTLSMIEDTFKKMDTDEDEAEPEGQSSRYHVTMITTIVLSSVVVAFLFYWQFQAGKLIKKRKNQPNNKN